MFHVTKAVIKDGDKHLLVKRLSTKRVFPSLWDFPGGKIDPGETPNECVIRETKEETELDITVDDFIIESEYHEGGLDIHYHIFEAKSFQGNVNINDEHDDFKWLTKEEIIQLELTPFVKKYFEN